MPIRKLVKMSEMPAIMPSFNAGSKMPPFEVDRVRKMPAPFEVDIGRKMPAVMPSFGFKPKLQFF